MVIQWVGAAITLLLLALVLGGIWWLVGDAKAQRRRERAAKRYAQIYDVEPTSGMGLLGRMGKHRRPGHLLHGEDNSLTVDELLGDAAAQGQPVRLNWSVMDEQRAQGQSFKRTTVAHDWPTGILPRVPKDPE